MTGRRRETTASLPYVLTPNGTGGGPMNRCGWAKGDLSIKYHDEEWGVPVHDDRRWFEFLVLEGAQAGLSWDTILRKRENYQRAFADFDPAIVAPLQSRTNRSAAE